MKYNRELKDFRNRREYKKTEIKKKMFKLVFRFNWQAKNNLSITCQEFNSVQPITRIKNYCVISGRARGVSQKNKISRIVFRELSAAGFLFGYKKISW